MRNFDFIEPLGCNYFGSFYQISEQIDTGNPCEQCVCMEDPVGSKKGQVNCSLTECQDKFDFSLKNPDVPEYKNCFYAYDNDKCCGTLKCLDENELNKTTCKYHGYEFKLGQRVYPIEDTCQVCICDERWNVKDPLKSPSCTKFKCSYSQIESDKVRNGCIPVFEKHSCCPSDYICREFDLLHN